MPGTAPGNDLTRAAEYGQPSMAEQVNIAAAYLRKFCPDTVHAGLILGSGLGDIPSFLTVKHSIAYTDIPRFPNSTAPGHSGNLHITEFQGTSILVFQGRFHLYEGWHPTQIALGIYVLKALGANELVVTNAAGALNPNYQPGDLMLIEDHLNFTGHSPLIGQNEDLGPTFPDMSQAYAPDLLIRIRAAADAFGQSLQSGIYAAVTGPALETSAERRFFSLSGADAIGMSTVPEVIAANHCGLKVLGISAITNMAVGGPDQKVDSIEEVFANAAVAGRAMLPLLQKFFQN